MWKLLICGGKLHPSDHQDQDRDHHDKVSTSSSAGTSPCSTPKKSRRTCFCRGHNEKNKIPYATRGRDEFLELLADLEHKRRSIYSQTTGSQDISIIRFVSKNSNDLVPIVVKLKDNKKEEKPNKNFNTCNGDNVIKQRQTTQHSEISHVGFPIEGSEQSGELTNRSFLSWEMAKLNWYALRRPWYYLLVVVILFLVFLALFGRSVVIICTLIGWYVVPMLKDNSRRKRTVVNKKEYAKKLSERNKVFEGFSTPRINKSP